MFLRVFISVFFIAFGLGQLVAQPISDEYSHDHAEEDSLRKIIAEDSSLVLFIDDFFDYKFRKLSYKVDKFHDYNPLDLSDKQFQTLGYTGSNYNNIFKNFSRAIDITSGFDDFAEYGLKVGKLKYYQAKAPLTELQFNLGTYGEQMLQGTHTQNINPKWNVGFNFKRLVNQGAYQRQKTGHTNARAFTWGRSKNDRYNIFIDAFINSGKVQENGGISLDSLFSQFVDVNGNLIFLNSNTRRSRNPNLIAAENRYNSKNFNITQTWDDGFYDRAYVGDSMVSRTFYPLFRYHHKFSYQHKHIAYEDEQPSLNFYPDILIDTANTLDSVNFYQYKNEFGYNIMPIGGMKDGNLKYRKATAGIAIRHSIHKNFNNNYDTTVNSLVAMANAQINPESASKIKFGVNGSISYSGYNNGDYTTAGFVNYELANKSKLQLSISSEQHSPALKQLRYSGNHANWQNIFEDEKLKKVSLSFNCKTCNLSITATHQQLKNYIYYNLNALPQQSNSTLYLNQLTVQKDFEMGKRFYLNNGVNIQNTSNTAIYAAPTLLLKHEFLYQNTLFNNALNFKTGVVVTYFTGYYPNAYRPDLRVFHQQRTFKSRPYPELTYLLNFNVKTFRFSLFVTDITQGLFRGGYYVTPDYPKHDRAVKGGVNWRFYF